MRFFKALGNSVSHFRVMIITGLLVVDIKSIKKGPVGVGHPKRKKSCIKQMNGISLTREVQTESR
jgi:hypothetical protein